MSKELPTKISIDPTSIINLKAELLKKQEEFKLRKLAQSSKTSAENEYETSKTNSTWGKKNLKAKEEIEKKIETEKSLEPAETEEDVLKKSRKMLESKARYYEQVTSGQKLSEEGDEEIFLVNFDQKIVETGIEKEKLKLKTEINEEDYNEQLRRKWEKEKYENLEKTSIRYEDVRYDEIRNLGVGNFRFSKDEVERQKQMEFFKDLHLETQTNRIQNEIYNLKREKSLKERLNKVKQRRLLKHGYSLAEIKEMCPYDKEIEEIDEEIKELEEFIKNPELLKANKDEKNEEEGEEFDKVRMKKKINFDREWDKPKLKEKFWEKHVEKLRSERQKQFAPPQSYDKNKQTKKSKKRKAKETTKQETEPSKSESSFQFSAEQFSYFYPPPPTSSFSTGSFIPFPNLNSPPPNFQMTNFQNQQNNS